MSDAVSRLFGLDKPARGRRRQVDSVDRNPQHATPIPVWRSEGVAEVAKGRPRFEKKQFVHVVLRALFPAGRPVTRIRQRVGLATTSQPGTAAREVNRLMLPDWQQEAGHRATTA